MDPLITFLIYLIIFLLFCAIILYLLKMLLSAWGVDNKIAVTIYVLVCLLMLLVAMRYLPIPFPSRH